MNLPSSIGTHGGAINTQTHGPSRQVGPTAAEPTHASASPPGHTASAPDDQYAPQQPLLLEHRPLLRPSPAAALLLKVRTAAGRRRHRRRTRRFRRGRGGACAPAGAGALGRAGKFVPPLVEVVRGQLRPDDDREHGGDGTARGREISVLSFGGRAVVVLTDKCFGLGRREGIVIGRKGLFAGHCGRASASSWPPPLRTDTVLSTRIKSP